MLFLTLSHSLSLLNRGVAEFLQRVIRLFIFYNERANNLGAVKCLHSTDYTM